MEKINTFKLSVVTIFTAISSLLGWFGWLVVIFIVCMTIDWLTGSAVALKNGTWKSKIGREGLWHKCGSVVAIVCAILFDLMVGLVVNNIPSLTLPFTYTILFSALVIIWYILTEMGSILENAGGLGARIPLFLQKAIASLKGGVEKTAEKAISDSEIK